MRRPHRCVLCLCLGLASCAPERPGDLGKAATTVSESGQKPVAQVGQHVITRQDLEARIKQLSLYEGRLETPEQRQDFLGSYVTMVAMAQDARKRGLQNTHGSTVRAVLDQNIAALHTEATLTKKMAAHEVTPEQVMAAYDPAAYTLPKRWQVIEIHLTTEEFAQKIRQKLIETPTPNQLEVAKTLAARHGITPTLAARDGQQEVTAESEGEVARSIRTQGSELAVTPIVRENGVWKFALLYGIKPSVTRPFDEVEESIRVTLTTKKRADLRAQWLKALRKTHHPDVDHTLLDGISPPDAVLALRPPEPF